MEYFRRLSRKNQLGPSAGKSSSASKTEEPISRRADANTMGEMVRHATDLVFSKG